MDQLSVYHISDAYATKKENDPNTPIYMGDLTSENKEQYWNKMDYYIFQFVKRMTSYVVPRSSAIKAPVYPST